MFLTLGFCLIHSTWRNVLCHCVHEYYCQFMSEIMFCYSSIWNWHHAIFFWGGSKGESEVAAHVLTSSRQLFSGLQCLNLSQPSYWAPVTLELLVLLKSSQMPGCFLLHDCAPITWKGAFFLCDLVHFFLINSLLWRQHEGLKLLLPWHLLALLPLSS